MARRRFSSAICESGISGPMIRATAPPSRAAGGRGERASSRMTQPAQQRLRRWASWSWGHSFSSGFQRGFILPDQPRLHHQAGGAQDGGQFHVILGRGHQLALRLAASLQQDGGVSGAVHMMVREFMAGRGFPPPARARSGRISPAGRCRQRRSPGGRPSGAAHRAASRRAAPAARAGARPARRSASGPMSTAAWQRAAAAATGSRKRPGGEQKTIAEAVAAIDDQQRERFRAAPGSAARHP